MAANSVSSKRGPAHPVSESAIPSEIKTTSGLRAWLQSAHFSTGGKARADRVQFYISSQRTRRKAHHSSQAGFAWFTNTRIQRSTI